MTGFWLASYLALWALVIVMAITLLVVLRNFGVIYDHLGKAAHSSAPASSLLAGDVLPEVQLRDSVGNTITSTQLGGTAAAIAIVSAGCQHCLALLSDIRKGIIPPDPLDASVTDWVFVGTGDISPIAAELDAAAAASSARLLFDPTGQIAQRWGISSVPMTVVVDEALRVVRQSVGHLQTAA